VVADAIANIAGATEEKVVAVGPRVHCSMCLWMRVNSTNEDFEKRWMTHGGQGESLMPLYTRVSVSLSLSLSLSLVG